MLHGKGKKTAAAVLAAGILAAAIAVGVKLWRTAEGLYVDLVQRIDAQAELISQTVAADWGGMVGENRRYAFNHDWTEAADGWIAHALGGIDGADYTNSLEAFRHNYSLGYRVFEADMDLSADNQLILSHDIWRWQQRSDAPEGTAYTAENFLASKIDGLYTTMDAWQLMELMHQYPDMVLVTDTKYYDKLTVTLQFAQLVRCAQQTDPEILDRIVPQIYKTEMLDWVMDVYPFSSVIYTLYDTAWTPQSVTEFCQLRGVDCVTLPAEDLTEDIARTWHEAGLTIGVHTVNDSAQADELRQLGADILYSDFLTPKGSDD